MENLFRKPEHPFFATVRTDADSADDVPLRAFKFPFCEAVREEFVQLLLRKAESNFEFVRIRRERDAPAIAVAVNVRGGMNLWTGKTVGGK